MHLHQKQNDKAKTKCESLILCTYCKLQEHGLYYDGNNGCYYKYNQEENKFEFHSQVYTDENETIAKDKKKQVNHLKMRVQCARGT